MKYGPKYGYTNKEIRNYTNPKKSGLDVFKMPNICSLIQRRQCEQNDVCMRFWPDGRIFMMQNLASRLKKDAHQLTEKDKIRAHIIEREAFKKCRAIRIDIERLDE